MLARHDVAVLFGQGHGHTEGHAPWNDGDLVQRVGLVEHVGQQCVATFVKGNALALIVHQHHRVAQLAHHDPVSGVLEVLHANRH